MRLESEICARELNECGDEQMVWIDIATTTTVKAGAMAITLRPVVVGRFLRRHG